MPHASPMGPPPMIIMSYCFILRKSDLIIQQYCKNWASIPQPLMNKFKSCFLFYSLIVTALSAQHRISVEDFTTINTFTENSVTGINWMNDGKFYSALS